MSFGFLGIQFGFALQNANTSRIFETLGADTSSLALYWLAAPITGLLVQPIVGYYSDRTWHPTWGRRRPFFAVGAILASFTLCVMPNSAMLWMAVGTLWIMDASINISMEPFRAFVGDMLPPSQRTAGFAMQSFFIGVGAVVASMLPWMFSNWLGISNVGESGHIADSVKYSFYVGAFMLFVTVMWTVLSTKEYPPDETTEDNQRNKENRHIKNPEKSLSQFLRVGSILSVTGFAVLFFIFSIDTDKELFVLGGGLLAFGVFILMAALYVRQGRTYLGLVHMVNDFLGMPRTMLQLAYVQFFSWFALFAMWIYTTSAVTSHIYDMKISADQIQTLELHIATLDESAFDDYAKTSVINDLTKVKEKTEDGFGTLNIKLTQFFLDKKVVRDLPSGIKQNLQSIQKEFNTGADWVGILFAVYNAVAALAALMLPILAKYTSR
ncbi:MAG TPA: MFS transporter, partial [Cyclobacteriaceae bacterium]